MAPRSARPHSGDMASQRNPVRHAHDESVPPARGLPRLFPAAPTVLILGSYPGVTSLWARQYYAHPQNAFWRIIEALFAIPASDPYKARARALRRTHLALWDVCHSARRPGSLDAKIRIRDVVPNDFVRVLAANPGIARICFNGQTAAKLFHRLVLPTLGAASRPLAFITLPSSSPANTRSSFDDKLSAWRAGLRGPNA